MKGANIIQSIEIMQNYELHQKKLQKIKTEIDMKKNKKEAVIDMERE